MPEILQRDRRRFSSIASREDSDVPGGRARRAPGRTHGHRTARSPPGHRRIAFINTTTPSPAHDRSTGRVPRSARERGYSVRRGARVRREPQQEGGYDTVAPILDRGATAVFCHNDRVAMGLYDGLRERGLSHSRGYRGDRLRQPGGHRRPPPSAAHRPSRCRTTSSAPPVCGCCSASRRRPRAAGSRWRARPSCARRSDAGVDQA